LAEAHGGSTAEERRNRVLLGTADVGRESRLQNAQRSLGTDYAEAKRRCDEVLNPHFDAWRLRDETPPADERTVAGTFDWMTAVAKSSPKWPKRPATVKSYDAALRLVSAYVLKDGRKFGALSLKNITPDAADRLYEKLKLKSDGTERTRTAILCQRAWGLARRAKPHHVPLSNPFEKMSLSYTAQRTRPVSYNELMRFVEAADAMGEGSIGTAAMIAFFWLQRQHDILARLTWSHYRPAGSGQNLPSQDRRTCGHPAL